MLAFVLRREETEAMRLVKELYVGKREEEEDRRRCGSNAIKSNMKRDSVSRELG